MIDDLKFKRKEGGFTLLELLVVISIIGILVALTMFNFQQARERARDVQRKSEIKQVQNALEMYKNDQNPQSYPAGSGAIPVILETNDYMTIPIDPLTKGGATWPDYAYSVSGLTYSLSTCLENEADKDAEGGVDCGTDGILYTVTQP